jgi:hypothetical protein
MLTRHPEHRSAGNKQFHIWTRVQKIGERRGGWQELFEVVKNQQVNAVSQHSPEHVKHRAALGPHSERGGDGG